MIKAGIYGARGRMGIELCQSVEENPQFQIAALYERPGHPEIGKEFYGCRLSSDVREFLKDSDVVIDFTSPEGTRFLLESNRKFKRPLVIGTTGISEEEQKFIQDASKNFPIVFSPNYSIGVNLLLKILKEAGRVLSKNKGYDLEIVELHHRFKKDSPSGTALKLAEVAAAASGRNLSRNVVYGRQGNVGERSIDEVGIFAIRAGDIIGEHKVIFSALGERVEIGHKAHSRQTFSKGALEAALWIGSKKSGLFSMENVLGL